MAVLREPWIDCRHHRDRTRGVFELEADLGQILSQDLHALLRARVRIVESVQLDAFGAGFLQQGLRLVGIVLIVGRRLLDVGPMPRRHRGVGRLAVTCIDRLGVGDAIDCVVDRLPDSYIVHRRLGIIEEQLLGIEPGVDVLHHVSRAVDRRNLLR